MKRHAEFGKLSTNRRQTTLQITQAAQNSNEIRRSRKNDIDASRIDESAIDDSQRGGHNAQLDDKLTQLLHIPLTLYTERHNLRVQIAQFLDQLQELPILVFLGHTQRLRDRKP